MQVRQQAQVQAEESGEQTPRPTPPGSALLGAGSAAFA